MATTYGNTMGHTGTMGGSLGNAGSIAKDKIDTASDSLKGAVDQGTQKAAEVKDRIKDSLAEAKDRLVDATGAVKDKIVHGKDVVVDRTGSFFSEARRLIKANPFVAIGIAFGVGYVAMRLVRR